MSDDTLYRRAEKRADEKISFYKHLYSFVGVNLLLFIVNALTSFGEWWFYWVTIFWGIGLIIHFLKIYIFTDRFEDTREKIIEKEMEKMKKE